MVLQESVGKSKREWVKEKVCVMGEGESVKEERVCGGICVNALFE